MSKVKSFSVGEGDMFYISHNSDNFTIIDCCLNYDEDSNAAKANILFLSRTMTRRSKCSKLTCAQTLDNASWS